MHNINIRINGEIMPILSEKLSVKIDVDDVLRGQGTDPTVIRSRKGKLLKTAEQALFETEQLVQNMVVYREMKVTSHIEDKLIFTDDSYLKGQLIKNHLVGAEKVIVLLCSIGNEIEKRLSEVATSNLLYGLAIHGVGSAAVESLANAACEYFTKQAKKIGMCTTIPISPGMNGWSLHEGQKQIFSLFNRIDPLDIKLNDQGIMVPKKSLSMVVGVGKKVNIKGRTCDHCNMKDICRHKKSDN